MFITLNAMADATVRTMPVDAAAGLWLSAGPAAGLANRQSSPRITSANCTPREGNESVRATGRVPSN